MPYLAATQDEKMFRVVRDRERWFQIIMGEKYEVDEAATDCQAARVPLPRTVQVGAPASVNASWGGWIAGSLLPNLPHRPPAAVASCSMACGTVSACCLVGTTLSIHEFLAGNLVSGYLLDTNIALLAASRSATLSAEARQVIDKSMKGSLDAGDPLLSVGRYAGATGGCRAAVEGRVRCGGS